MRIAYETSRGRTLQGLRIKPHKRCRRISQEKIRQSQGRLATEELLSFGKMKMICYLLSIDTTMTAAIYERLGNVQ